MTRTCCCGLIPWPAGKTSIAADGVTHHLDSPCREPLFEPAHRGRSIAVVLALGLVVAACFIAVLMDAAVRG